MQTNRYSSSSKTIQTGEAYLHFRDLPLGKQSIGFKAGRIDIPFGEDYLRQDSFDNPLITHSAAWPYGWDEGFLLYGKYHGLGWVTSITDGSDVVIKMIVQIKRSILSCTVILATTYI